MKKTILELPISRKNAYELKELKKGERIPIVSDVMFHAMLNNESRKKYVAYLLSLVLDKDFEEINENIRFIKNNIDKNNVHESNKTVDLVCQIEDRIYNIEMNNNGTHTSIERNIDYANQLYSSKMTTGHHYDYQYVLQININNFSFVGVDKAIDDYMLRDEDGNILTDKIRIITIYLPKIKEKYYNKDRLTELEKLLLVFNEKDSKDLDEIIEGDKIMQEYRKDSLEASEDEKIIGLYDKELHLEMLHNSELKEAREKGLEQGEQKAKIETAKNLLKNGASLSLVLSSTGLTKKDLDLPKDYEDEEVIGLYDKELHLEMLHNSELKEAREKGLEQGEQKAKIETAKNLLKNGASLSLVLSSTGLTKKDLDLPKDYEDEEVIGLYDKELHLEMLHNSELKEAREKGLEQGRREEKIEAAKLMLAKEIDLKTISECTNLSIEEIEKLS